MLRLNLEQMPLPTLGSYHQYLCSLRFDPMTSNERLVYPEERTRAAQLLAFPLKG